MTTLLIKPASQPTPKTEKRLLESILYTLDCRELLDKNELIQSVEVIKPPSGIVLSGIRPRKGNSIEVRISGGPSAAAAYMDYTITLAFKTTKANTKLAVFQLRVVL